MSDPEFPPLLTGHDVKPPSIPFRVAIEGAARGELGAGDILWSRDNSIVRFAIILEPEIALQKAMQMISLTLVACGDCIGALAPPQVGITYRWPADILVNAGKVGDVTAAAVGAETPDDVPDRLVLGVELGLRRAEGGSEPGHNPDITTLFEEGCTNLTSTQLISSCCRHFLTWLNKWENDGFASVSEAWTYRAELRGKNLELDYCGEGYKGVFENLDDNGNLVLKTADGSTQTLQILQMLDAFDIDAKI